jgi:hypothetical protein
MKKIADLVEAQAKKQEQNHSELRSSNSSIMASSQSQHEKLEELRSMQSILSGKMDKLFDANPHPIRSGLPSPRTVQVMIPIPKPLHLASSLEQEAWRRLLFDEHLRKAERPSN